MFSGKDPLWILTGLLAVTTVFFNIYILLMSLWNHQQKKQWCASETIIVALGVANVAHQLVCYFWMTMDQVDQGCLMDRGLYTFTVLLIYSLKFTVMWDTSFLTFYYSTKLVSTPNHCYTQIQAFILKHVMMAVLFIPLCGLGASMPMLAVFHHHNDTMKDQDCGVLIPDNQSGRIYEAVYLLLTDVLSGVLMVKCCISISVHLAIHLHHMKESTNGAHAPKLGTQMRVIRMALALVVVFIVFLVVDLYVQYEIVVHHENIITLTFFFTSVYTTTTAIVLIYGKKTFWKSLLHEVNVFLDEFPCLSRLKVPEEKIKHCSMKVKN